MSKKEYNYSADAPWHELSPGGNVYDAGSAQDFETGDWRAMKPIWIEEKCTQCMLCPPTCPDTSIPVEDGKRLDYDYDHCKGCGVCVAVCPFEAIEFVEEDSEEEGK